MKTHNFSSVCNSKPFLHTLIQLWWHIPKQKASGISSALCTYSRLCCKTHLHISVMKVPVIKLLTRTFFSCSASLQYINQVLPTQFLQSASHLLCPSFTSLVEIFPLQTKNCDAPSKGNQYWNADSASLFCFKLFETFSFLPLYSSLPLASPRAHTQECHKPSYLTSVTRA